MDKIGLKLIDVDDVIISLSRPSTILDILGLVRPNQEHAIYVMVSARQIADDLDQAITTHASLERHLTATKEEVHVVFNIQDTFGATHHELVLKLESKQETIIVSKIHASVVVI